MLRKAQPLRPFSRLDNIIESKPGKNFIGVAGIPEKNRSGSKTFPYFVEENEKQNQCSKQNRVLLAPKKQEKSVSQRQENQNAQSLAAQVSKVVQQMEIKCSDEVYTKGEKQDAMLGLAQHLQIVNESCAIPISMVVRNKRPCPPASEQNQEDLNTKQSKGGRLVEEKSFARRVKQRIEAENARNEEKRRQWSIGEDAYVPYPLQELKQQIGLKTRKNSCEVGDGLVII